MGGDLIITGGMPLNGTVHIPAAKNSVLPLLAAALLCNGTVRFLQVPHLADVDTSVELLQGAGCTARWQGSDITVQGVPSTCRLAPEAAARMRASILFCAPLLARLGRVETVLPGGCRIGARPVDLHLSGLAQMGVHCREEGARLILTAPAGLHGADITLGFPSVGATETLLLAAAAAQGETVLRGAAREPEISDLAAFLNRCGGCVQGAGTSTIRVQGRRMLYSCSFAPMADRIVASTLACACAAAGGRVETVLPGGCRIGARPVDLHLSGLAQMGVHCREEGARLILTAPAGLHGADITLGFPSVGATETLLLAAAAAQGETVLRGAAREPEISDLAAFLNRCGGCVQGAGTSTIRVQGRRMLYSCSFAPMADRIVASTLACACAAAGGRVELTGCRPETYAPLLEILAQMGCRVETGPESAVITRLGALHGAGRVFTGVYPALATDAAPLLAAAMLAADSASSIEDVVFERRFGCAEGFAAFGAAVQVQGRTLDIRPVRQLQGACTRAADLRGGAALVVAALAARGQSRITDTGYIDRGYAGFAQMLAELGAQIEREMPRESASEKKTPSKKQN